MIQNWCLVMAVCRSIEQKRRQNVGQNNNNMFLSSSFLIRFSGMMPLEKVETVLHIYIYGSRRSLHHSRASKVETAINGDLYNSCSGRARVWLSHTLSCPPPRATRFPPPSPPHGIINDGESSRRSVSKVIKRGANV